MTRTLADYVPMLESIQDDPTNQLTPDYVNAIIHYKNRQVLFMVDEAGVNIELFAPDSWQFSISKLSHDCDEVMMHVDPKEGSPVNVEVDHARNAREVGGG